MNPRNNRKDEIVELIESTGLHSKTSDFPQRIEFKDLMNYRIDKILMVCSYYDYYTIIEDGHLQEAIFNEYLDLNLYYAPHIIRANSGSAAIKLLQEEKFDLIIVTLRIGDIEISEFCDYVKKDYEGIPVVLLASQSRELYMQLEKGNLSKLDKIFIWSGDRKVFLAIIKYFEDRVNAVTDCLQFGVTAIILVEDSPGFYSAYLPQIYTEIMKQTQRLIEEGKNSSEKLLRQRARPKIFLAETYEEAWNYIDKYRNYLLGIITDLEFKKDGKKNKNAGFDLIKSVRSQLPDLPILLQSSNPEGAAYEKDLELTFIDKNSRTLLLELSDFMNNNFGFGDFVFRTPDGIETGRAKNLHDLRESLKYAPEESLLYHSQHNHFSYWLTARTEFELAYKLKPIKNSQFKTAKDLRQHLIQCLSHQITENRRGVISVFQREDYDDSLNFQIIGDGSLGGKARGLAFIDKILKEYIETKYFEGINVSIPRTMVLGTDVFTQFMERNNLYKTAVQNISDEHILREFLNADLPPTVLGDLREILKKVRYPIAVRSSSLLEDAVYQPFAGVYATVMIPNSSIDMEIRFHNLVQAIKLVFASTFSRNAKNYIEATGNRIEEEKMGVILQEMVGHRFGKYFYPHFSGVARSYNYYPFGNAQPKDGIVNLALGLGKQIVEGAASLQYSPAYPSVFPQFASSKDYFSKSQVKFWALDLQSDFIHRNPNEDQNLVELELNVAEKHGVLDYIASTYSGENDRLYEGIYRNGPRVIDFASILKSNIIPLNDLVSLLLRMSEVAMNCPVEIEFAATLGKDGARPADFKFLQVRPMVKPEGVVNVDFETLDEDSILLQSNTALGNGTFELRWVLYIEPGTFEVSKTRAIAEEIAKLNKEMMHSNRSYLLIGPGRWGSSDPWLGIPVVFSSISAAQAIVETPMPHMVVEPSQGSHFFQNMTSFKISYFTTKDSAGKSGVDYDWLNRQEIEYESQYIKLVKLSSPVKVMVDGHTQKGVVLKL